MIAYGRVSTADQAESGAGLAAQRTAVGAACAGRGWQLVQTYEDAGISGKAMANRPGLLAALEAIENGRASGLVVAKLDRLSRSLLDFARSWSEAVATAGPSSRSTSEWTRRRRAAN